MNKNRQWCEEHKVWVYPKISKKNKKPYWRCEEGEGHFLKDPNYDPHEGYGQDDEGNMC